MPMMITEDQASSLRLRELEEEDAPLLVRWLSDPQVLMYYEGRDRPHDLALVRQHFYEDRGELVAGIIQHEERDIGYLQFYPIEEEERSLYGYDDPQEVIYGLDQFIGEVDCWNRGIGSALIRMMIRFLTVERGADRLVMDPQAWNERAIRVYEKCGFVKIKRLPQQEWHEGEYRDCWQMEYRVRMADSHAIRPIKETDIPFLWEMLYQSLFVAEGEATFDRSVIHNPELSKYVEGWGRAGDFGFIALNAQAEPIGSIYARNFDEGSQGYGFVSKDVPELGMALLPAYRGIGIGTSMMRTFIKEARKREIKQLSLSVDPRNEAAMKLYERFGFKKVGHVGTSITMVRDWLG